MYGDTRTLECPAILCNAIQFPTNVLPYHNKLNTTTTRWLQRPSHQLPCDPRASRPTFSGMYWWTGGQKTWTWTVSRVQLRPAAPEVIFGEDNAAPRDHWVAPDERKDRLMGIHQPPIRSRSRVSSAPSHKFFGRDHQTNHVDRDGRVRFQICSVQDATLVGFFLFLKPHGKERKPGSLSFLALFFPGTLRTHVLY